PRPPAPGPSPGLPHLPPRAEPLGIGRLGQRAPPAAPPVLGRDTAGAARGPGHEEAGAYNHHPGGDSGGAERPRDALSREASRRSVADQYRGPPAARRDGHTVGRDGADGRAAAALLRYARGPATSPPAARRRLVRPGGARRS